MATHLRSRALAAGESGALLEVTRHGAGWQYLGFAVRQLAADHSWSGESGDDEVCIVLLEGTCEASWPEGAARLGPRRDVFSGYPHALYLPPGVRFTVHAVE